MFHALSVHSVTQETLDTISITFDIPSSIKSQFQYLPGMFLTLKVNVNGKEYRRAYSLSSSPTEDELLTVTTKRVTDGVVSNWLNDNVIAGTVIDVMPPQGKFIVEAKPNNKKTYVLFGGGSGVTPMVSILRTVLTQEPNSKLVLIYANRNTESIIFKKKLTKLQEEFSDRITIIHILEEADSEIAQYTGRLNSDIISEILQKHVGMMMLFANYYICGPNGMMDTVVEALKAKKINANNIHLEKFSSATPEETAETLAAAGISKDSDKTQVNLVWEGKTYNFAMRPGLDLLTAALEAGIDPPFACQIGACSTCKAKLLEGNVKMLEREALTDEEIKDGYILTCQSYPTTPNISVNYNI